MQFRSGILSLHHLIDLFLQSCDFFLAPFLPDTELCQIVFGFRAVLHGFYRVKGKPGSDLFDLLIYLPSFLFIALQGIHHHLV